MYVFYLSSMWRSAPASYKKEWYERYVSQRNFSSLLHVPHASSQNNDVQRNGQPDLQANIPIVSITLYFSCHQLFLNYTHSKKYQSPVNSSFSLSLSGPSETTIIDTNVKLIF